ncbi:imm11 family protein [Parapedobacter sp. DT-150]
MNLNANAQWFNLATTVNHPLAVVDFKDGSSRLFDYFVLDKGDGRFLDFAKPTAIAQSGYTKRNITSTDFVKASIGIPIFSVDFKDKLEAELKDDLLFFECTVNCQGEAFPFYAGKVLRYISLIDRERSTFRTLSDGSSLPAKAVYREDIPEPFLVARDTDFPSRFAVSTVFRKLVEAHGLKVGFI